MRRLDPDPLEVSMDEQTRYTEADLQRARREAWMDGFRECEDGAPIRADSAYLATVARQRYPIKKKVPREVRDATGVEWRIKDGELEYRISGREWLVSGNDTIRVALWADLLENPHREVDE